MAILVHNVSKEWTRELYERVTKKALGGTLTPAKLPPGLIFHAAGAHPAGGWEVFDVWESEASWQKFLEGALIPAAVEMRAPAFDTKISPVHNFLK